MKIDTLYEVLNKKYNFTNRIVISTRVGDEVAWGKVNFVISYDNNKLSKTSLVSKALVEADKGNKSVLVLQVSTSTPLFHDVILPNAKDLKFLRGRIKLDSKHTTKDTMIVTF